MVHAGDVIENPVTGQRLVFVITPAASGGELFAAEGIFPPGGFAGVPHIHPHQDERFEVLAGDAAFDIDGSRHVLGAGNTIDVPRGTKHTFANAGEEEMRVRFEFRPALASTGRFYELYFAFAQQGRVNAKAMPGLLDIATVWPITSEHAVLATPPTVIQHALFRLLAPIARIARRQPPVCRPAPAYTEQSSGSAARDSHQGIDRERPDHLRPPQNAVQLDQQLVLGSSRETKRASGATRSISSVVIDSID